GATLSRAGSGWSAPLVIGLQRHVIPRFLMPRAVSRGRRSNRKWYGRSRRSWCFASAAEGLSRRQIAAQGMSRHSVDAVIAAADAIGVSYDDVAVVPDAEVYARLFPGRGEHHSVYAQPDWDEVHREIAKVGVTLKLLHGEYRDGAAAAGAPAVGYDRFCKTYQRHVLV